MDEQEVADAVRRWNACQSEVNSAIQSYLEASFELHMLCVSPPDISLTSAASISSQLEQSFSDLPFFEDALYDARCALESVPSRLARGDLSGTLPDEVLSTIFLFGLEQNVLPMALTDEEDEEFNVQTPSSFAFLLAVSSVCCRWCNVALDTGALWTSIDCLFKSPPEKVEAFFQRSKLCLIEIHCEFHHEIPGHLVVFLQLLAVHAGRCTMLSLRGSRFALQRALDTLLSQQDPAQSPLHTLAIRI